MEKSCISLLGPSPSHLFSILNYHTDNIPTQRLYLVTNLHGSDYANFMKFAGGDLPFLPK
jgi:hypothetical protein